MVKANELRVGNWIKHGESPSSFEYPDTIFQVTIDMFFEMARSRISDYHLEPIPLTPEILEQCGFVENVDHYELHVKALTSACFKATSYDGHWSVYLHASNWKHSTRAFYLHQLQNLYFALTNEELIFQSIKELK